MNHKLFEIYFEVFMGIDYLRVLFLLLNLEVWNLACECKIEIP